MSFLLFVIFITAPSTGQEQARGRFQTMNECLLAAEDFAKRDDVESVRCIAETWKK